MARRKDRPIGPLDSRTAQILRAIIEEHIETAQPVGSQALVERRGLAVSSATVRNVMADLERAGFLSHPHTSAGRVPTDLGYRYYVETVRPYAGLAPVEQLMIRHQFGQVQFANEQWFRLAAATLAGATRAAGLATPAKPRSSRVRRVDLVAGGERLANLVLVLAEGPIKQVLVNLDAPLDQPGLDRVAGRLNARLAERDALGVQDAVRALSQDPSTDAVEQRAAERIAQLMRDFDASSVDDVFSEGLLNVMEAPEFAQSDKLRRVFAALQNRQYLGRLVDDVARLGDVQIFIGAENEPSEMHDVSLVLAPYGRAGRAIGVVGVLGPRRMAYSHAIGTVRYVSGLLNELVDDLYA